MLVGAVIWFVGRGFYVNSRDPVRELIEQRIRYTSLFWGIVLIIGFLIAATNALIFAWRFLP
jgi:hypothetical protein